MEMEQRRKFGINLGKLREKAGLSQQKLADETGINRETIAKYETFKRIPSYEHLTALTKYFNTTTDYLLGLTENYNRNNKSRSACDYLNLNLEAIEFIKKHSEAFKVLIKINKFDDFIPSLYQSVCQNLQEAFIIKDLQKSEYNKELRLNIINNAKSVHLSKEIQEYRTQKLFFNILSEAYRNYPEDDIVNVVNRYINNEYNEE